ncbi:hypothetical protein BDR07DRAFT_1382244 [Suillus spraguei]|nr:hypothetical protein BDR07DRAFT_1382244 [Suillus spraguei]
MHNKIQFLCLLQRGHSQVDWQPHLLQWGHSQVDRQGDAFLSLCQWGHLQIDWQGDVGTLMVKDKSECLELNVNVRILTNIIMLVSAEKIAHAMAPAARTVTNNEHQMKNWEPTLDMGADWNWSKDKHGEHNSQVIIVKPLVKRYTALDAPLKEWFRYDGHAGYQEEFLLEDL